MKKIKRRTVPPVDDRRPTKAPPPPTGKRGRPKAADIAAVPSYDGPRKTDKMPSRDASHASPAKAAFKPGSGRRPAAAPVNVAPSDQTPGPSGGTGESTADREQYIRMRIHVRDDRLSVIDSHLVDGPLAQAPVFSGTNAYEVTIGDRLLHAGALPDLAVQRSFANPGGPPEQRGHYFTERPIFEFMARVPAREVTPETIGKITLRLHRIKDVARTDRLGSAPLARQFERQVRQIAELVGLPDSVLPSAIEERGGRTPSV
jgi:hypothetical protein